MDDAGRQEPSAALDTDHGLDGREPGGSALDATIGALNAVAGDYLAHKNNGLAIEMGLYQAGQPVPVDSASLLAAYPNAGEKPCLLIHGLAATESCWRFPDGSPSYGSRLGRDAGFTPLYLRYNSGLHVSENGRALAHLLEKLVCHWPARVAELTLIGHSLGGLLVRSACHYGVKLQHEWPTKLRHAIHVAAPHLGAPLEKIGNVVSNVLLAFSNPVVRLVREVLDQRSAGVKDTRYGNLVDEDWAGHDPDALLDNRRTDIPLASNASHYLIGSTLAANPHGLMAQFFGDAVVRVPSAFGVSNDTRLPAENIALLAGIGHLELAHHEAVYQQIKLWCAPAAGATSQEER